MSDRPKPLEGEYILIVDDEPLIAAMLEEVCIEAGAKAICAWQLSAGLRAASTPKLTMAMLDVRLGKSSSEEIADQLTHRGIPFLFYSGQVLPQYLKTKYPKAPLLLKPVVSTLVIKALLNLKSSRDTA